MEFVVTTPAAAGGAGVATATVNTPVPLSGYLESIEYHYAGGAPVTTVITVVDTQTMVLSGGRTIATVTAGNTDGVAYPRAAAVNTAGAAITNSAALIYIDRHVLTVNVSAANNGTIVTVLFRFSFTYKE